MSLVDWNDAAGVLKRDSDGYTVLEALTSAGLGVSATSSRPNAFVCIDGHTYWVKSSVQQGLVAEVIAGRLAERVGAGPPTRIVRVTPEALPADGSANHLLGIVVGSRDQPGMVNARDLPPLMGPGGSFTAGALDAPSRARSIVFHTWLAMDDSQVLVSLTDGKIQSIDHGACFGSVADPNASPAVVATDIAGTDIDECRRSNYLLDAVERVEAVSDDELVKSVAQVPGGAEWQSPVDRRLAIAAWLAGRRQKLREVFEAWRIP